MRSPSFPADLGSVVKTVRRQFGWSQAALAARIGVGQPWISEIERGLAPGVALATVDRLVRELGIRVVLQPNERSLSERAAQRDPAHAITSSYVARRLAGAGWEVASEVEIGGRSSRGWMDLFAFHHQTRRCLLIEVKTELRDFGALERQIGWYEREAPWVARRFGWRFASISTVVVLLATDANDDAVRDYATVLDGLVPRRAHELRSLVEGGTATESAHGGRYLAMVDPLGRRRHWLIPTRRDGRRYRLRHSNYAAFMARRARPPPPRP